MTEGKPKKIGHRFKPGVSGNPSGRPKAPADLVNARMTNATLFEDSVYKHMGITVAALELLMKDKTLTVRDMVVVRLLALAMQKGDIARFNFLLERTIGKVADKLDIRAAVVTKTLHDQIVDEIEANEVVDIKP